MALGDVFKPPWLLLIILQIVSAEDIPSPIEIQPTSQKISFQQIGVLQPYKSYGTVAIDIDLRCASKALDSLEATAVILANITGAGMTSSQILGALTACRSLLTDVTTRLSVPAVAMSAESSEKATGILQKAKTRSKRDTSDVDILTSSLNDKSVKTLLSGLADDEFYETINSNSAFLNYNEISSVSEYLQEIHTFVSDTTKSKAEIEAYLKGIIKKSRREQFIPSLQQFSRGLIQLTQNKIIDHFLNETTLHNSLAKLAKKATDRNMRLISTRHEIILKAPHTFIKQNDTFFQIICHLPILQGEPLTASYLIPQKFLIENQGYGFTMEFRPSDPFLAEDSASTHGFTLTNSQMKKCFSWNNTKFCPQSHLIKQKSKNCIFSLYNFNVNAITEFCPIFIAKRTQAVERIEPNRYRLMSTDPISIEVACTGKDPVNKIIQGLCEIVLSETCRSLKSVFFATSYDATHSKQPFDLRPFDIEAVFNKKFPSKKALSSALFDNVPKLASSINPYPYHLSFTDSIKLAYNIAISIALFLFIYLIKITFLYLLTACQNFKQRRNNHLPEYS